MHKTETHLPQDFIKIDDDTPKGNKGQVTSHKSQTADMEHDTGFHTDVDKPDGSQHHAAGRLRRTGYSIFCFASAKDLCIRQKHIYLRILSRLMTTLPRGIKRGLTRGILLTQDVTLGSIQMLMSQIAIGIMQQSLCVEQVALYFIFF